MADSSAWGRRQGFEPLPRNWERLRRRVLRASQVCHVCRRPGADEVDHVVPRSEGGSHELSNLAPIHRDPCHRVKSSREGNAAQAARRAAMRRPVERHPGLVG